MSISEDAPRRRSPILLIIGLILAIVTGVLLVVALLPPRQVSGTIQMADTEFSLRDGRATWQPETGWLTLYLSPQRLPKHSGGTGQLESNDQTASGSHLIHRKGGSAEFTIIFSTEAGRVPDIETVACAFSSPAAPDASRIFMQGHSDAPWIQAFSMTNGPGGSFVSLHSGGQCKDDQGRITWGIVVRRLPMEVIRE